MPSAFTLVPTPLPADPMRRLVSEPLAKSWIREIGIAIPRGVTVHDKASVGEAASALRAPLALKAFGPGIVHKTDLGAVALGLDHPALDAAAARMRAGLAERRIPVDGFLVEEQVSGGVELILGVVVRAGGVAVANFGLGGIYTEVLQAVETRLCPLTDREARELVADFPGAELLRGARGRSSVDVDAVVRALLAVAGENGLVARLLADGLEELELNPLLALSNGVVALDARVILGNTRTENGARRPTDFTTLFKPRSVAVAGVSTKPGGLRIGNRALAAYRRTGWTSDLYAIHPEASEVDGVPAYARLDLVPGGHVDYLKILAPAKSVPALIRQCEGRVGIAQVISGGFGEMGGEGSALEAQLLAAAHESHVRVVGPNCLGVYCPAGRQAFRVGDHMVSGSIGMIMQSGGLAGDVIATGTARGLRFSKVASIGNAIDVTLAEVLEFLVDDPETEVIGLYLESYGDGSRLINALRRARGVKPVVALMGGTTPAGAIAAASHTGAMVGEERLLEAICRSTGLHRVASMDELVGALVMHQRYAAERGTIAPSTVIIGNGGGATTLCADAAARAEVALPQFGNAAVEQLASMPLGVPKVLCNPLEVITNWLTPGSPTDGPRRVIEVLTEVQPYSDALVHNSMATYYGYGDIDIAPLTQMFAHLGEIAGQPTRIVFVARNADVIPAAHLPAIRESAQQHGVPLFFSVEAALAAIAAAQAWARQST